MKIRPFTATDVSLFNIPSMPAKTTAWTVEVGGTPIGYAAIAPVPGLPNLIELIGYIEPGYRRNGYGTALLRFLLEKTPHTKESILSIPCDNPDSAEAHFMRFHGFQVEHVETIMTLNKIDEVSLDMAPMRTLSLDVATELFRELHDDSFANEPWYQPYANAEEVLSDLGPKDGIWFYQIDGVPIGFAGVRHLGKGRVELEPIGIRRAYQNQGHGRAMLGSTLAKLRELSVDYVQLTVWTSNFRAIKLYESFGFVHAAERLFYCRSMSVPIADTGSQSDVMGQRRIPESAD